MRISNRLRDALEEVEEDWASEIEDPYVQGKTAGLSAALQIALEEDQEL